MEFLCAFSDERLRRSRELLRKELIRMIASKLFSSCSTPLKLRDPYRSVRSFCKREVPPQCTCAADFIKSHPICTGQWSNHIR